MSLCLCGEPNPDSGRIPPFRDYDFAFPDWLETYMKAMSSALGAAYDEPAGDVRGYIDYVRSQQG